MSYFSEDIIYRGLVQCFLAPYIVSPSSYLPFPIFLNLWSLSFTVKSSQVAGDNWLSFRFRSIMYRPDWKLCVHGWGSRQGDLTDTGYFTGGPLVVSVDLFPCARQFSQERNFPVAWNLEGEGGMEIALSPSASILWAPGEDRDASFGVGLTLCLASVANLESPVNLSEGELRVYSCGGRCGWSPGQLRLKPCFSCYSLPGPFGST